MSAGTGEENINVVLGAQVYASLLGGGMIHYRFCPLLRPQGTLLSQTCFSKHPPDPHRRNRVGSPQVPSVPNSVVHGPGLLARSQHGRHPRPLHHRLHGHVVALHARGAVAATARLRLHRIYASCILDDVWLHRRRCHRLRRTSKRSPPRGHLLRLRRLHDEGRHGPRHVHHRLCPGLASTPNLAATKTPPPCSGSDSGSLPCPSRACSSPLSW